MWSTSPSSECCVGASEGISRTLVPNSSEGNDVNQEIDTDEVMAQRAAAAFDAMNAVLALIDERRNDLSGLPAGAALVARADRVRLMYPAQATAEPKAQTA